MAFCSSNLCFPFLLFSTISHYCQLLLQAVLFSRCHDLLCYDLNLLSDLAVGLVCGKSLFLFFSVNACITLSPFFFLLVRCSHVSYMPFSCLVLFAPASDTFDTQHTHIYTYLYMCKLKAVTSVLTVLFFSIFFFFFVFKAVLLLNVRGRCKKKKTKQKKQRH